MVKTNEKRNTSLIPNFSEFDRVFDNFRRDLEKSFFSFPRLGSKATDTFCDVIDEGHQFRVKMNVPGVTKNDVSLNVTENSIEISAERKEESEEKKKNYLTKERSEVSYYRTLPLPDNIVPDKTKAKLTDGVLEIILPKTQPTKTQKKRTIKVQ